MLFLREPLLFLLLMFFINGGKSEIGIPNIAIAHKTKDDSYCASLDETSANCRNFREKRSPQDDNTTTESAVLPGSPELNNESVTSMDMNTDPPTTSNMSVNASATEASIYELNSTDDHNSSTISITITPSVEVNSTNTTSVVTQDILSGRNISENSSITANEDHNSTNIQNATESELADVNTELTVNGGNYTELESKMINNTQENYSADMNSTVTANETLVLTNMTAETSPENATSTNSSETFTTENTVDSTTVEDNMRRKREIQNPVIDENKSNGSLELNSTQSPPTNSMRDNNLNNSNNTLLNSTDSYSDMDLMNLTESVLDEPQNVSVNKADTNTTENIDSLISSTDIYTNKSEINVTNYEQITEESNQTTNTTDNITVDMSNNTTDNDLNITDSNGTVTDPNLEVENNTTNSSTESAITNLTVTNTTDGSSQSVSSQTNENERSKRGIDKIVIHTGQNATNTNTTSNATNVAEESDDIKESSLTVSTPGSILPKENQTEKVCLIQGEECTNSTECCENFECTMFDFIKWSKNCDFKPKDTQLTSPPPDVRIPKQPIQVQQAL